MAQLAIAKATFTAVLLRPDPAPCTRDDIEHFHALLGAAIDRCSPENVQKCKQWALRHHIQSPARAASLGKYLAALSGAAAPESSQDGPDGPSSTPAEPAATRGGRRPSAKRRRLHVLYVLNDLLYHVRVRSRDDAFARNFDAVLADLFRSAASFSHSPKHIRKVQDLLSIWQEREYFPGDLLAKVRAAVEDAPLAKASEEDEAAEDSKNATAAASALRAKSAPFVLPSAHGDASAPWYDLPAGNWLPVIQPNSTRPIDPAMVKPLQLAAGPADKALADAVRKLLADVDRIYAADLRLDADPAAEIDQMGERVEVDEVAGRVLGGDTYYGWSRAFCEKMKARRKKGGRGYDAGGDDDDRRGRSGSSMSRSPSRSPSRSRDRPSFKRRRLSPSRSRSHSRSRGRDYTPSPDRSHRRRSRSRSRSGPYRSPSRGRGGGWRNPSRSPGYSPPPPPPPPAHQPMIPSGFAHVPPPLPPNAYFQQQQQHSPPNFPPFPPPPPPSHGMPGNFPPVVPPPPPPNYNGQWPPPPPLPPSMQGWMPPGASPAVPWSGGWAGQNQQQPPVPVPVPLPPAGGYPTQQQGHHNPQFGGAGRGGGYGGRGGWNGGGGNGGSYGRGGGGW